VHYSSLFQFYFFDLVPTLVENSNFKPGMGAWFTEIVFQKVCVLCMHVCMHVCMHIRMCVHIYACMYVNMYVCM